LPGLRVSYSFGLSTNAVLQRETESLLGGAVAAYGREREAARQHDPLRSPVPARRFAGFWYQAGTWPQPRWVVVNVDAKEQPCTWRTLLIKVAPKVIMRTRRIVVRLSSSWPHLDWYRRVCECLRGPLPTPVPHPSG
jgi:hypothetical protein